MSVKALNKHKKPIDIQDDLESFFHVLLFICIRFLHHNLEDENVPQFMRDYFDDYTPSKTGPRCGPRKHLVIATGSLHLSAYNEAKGCLHFLWPSESGGSSPLSLHPLDIVITTLLSWFSAHHKLARWQPVQPVLRKQTEDRGEPLKLSSALAWIIEDEARIKKQGVIDSSPSPTQVLKEDHHKLREDLQQLAANLNTHKSTIQLLIKTLLHMRWPESDRRSVDLRLENRKAKADQVGKSAKATQDPKEGKSMGKGTKMPSRSRVSTRLKRNSQAAGNTDAGPSTKRRKL
ncbi:hypothetical protein C8Q78DRAFT_196174 [Trametes maxima]|nr:hypothetical protein C8Q78DRAFT_196174 [Trametes maxima]